MQLDGFDISFSAAPPSAWLPSNVTLRHLDIRAKDIPEDLVEKYDIVHIRAFAFVLQDPEILQVLQNLAKLLSIIILYKMCSSTTDQVFLRTRWLPAMGRT